jgi:PAS domain S-box-containing protein
LNATEGVFQGAVIYTRDLTVLTCIRKVLEADIAERRKTERLQNSIIHIASTAATHLGTQEFFRAIRHRLKLHLETSHIFLGLLSETGDELFCTELAGDQVRECRRPVGESPSKFMLQSGRSLLLCGEALQQFVREQSLDEETLQFQCWMGTPLVDQGREIGVLVAVNRPGQRPFDENGRKLLEFVGSQVAGIINHKQQENLILRLSRSVEQSPVSIVITDTNGLIEYVNPKFCEVTGYTREEVLGENPRILKSGETREEEYRELWRTITSGKTWKGLFHNRRKNGELFWEEATIGPVKDDSGRIVNFLALKKDITRRKETEDQLRALLQRYEQLLNAFDSLLIVTDRERRIERWNGTCEEVLGLSREEAVGRRLTDLDLEWSQESVGNSLEWCAQTRRAVALRELSVKVAEGETRFINFTVSPQLNGENLEGFLILGEDVTSEKMIAAQLAQAQKLEAIGQLAAGVAHEINTPVQFVSDNTHFLKDSFGDLLKLLELQERAVRQLEKQKEGADLVNRVHELYRDLDLDFLKSEVPQALNQSLEGLERVTQIVRALKEFSHPGGAEKVLGDVSRSLRNAITVSRNAWKYVAEVETHLDENLPPVPLHVNEFNQVILNIIVNAAHAISEVQAKGDPPGKITVVSRREPGWVIIEISDTGGGIPESIQDRVFDPFFTTKEVGRGTGQGLAIAHDIVVNKHRGRINFETEPGKGTTFFISLPLE